MKFLQFKWNAIYIFDLVIGNSFSCNKISHIRHLTAFYFSFDTCLFYYYIQSKCKPFITFRKYPQSLFALKKISAVGLLAPPYFSSVLFLCYEVGHTADFHLQHEPASLETSRQFYDVALPYWIRIFWCVPKLISSPAKNISAASEIFRQLFSIHRVYFINGFSVHVYFFL